MARIGIVTDSTCDLTPEQLRGLDVEMVPLKVLFGEDTFLDWTDIQPAEFYAKLTSAQVLPKTSQPSPAEFAAVYSSLAEQGCEAIVSIHLTAALSGTFQSATIAAAESPIPVHVIDTKKVSQAVGLVVKAAVDARAQGLDAEQIAARAQEVSDSMRMFFVLDTLDYLVKGGRAGKAQGLAASLLNIKPVLQMNSEGVVEPFKKLKGRKRAISELAAHVAEDAAAHGRMRVALLHACLEDCGAELAAELEAKAADVEIESSGLVGSVIGTYAGPNAVGCAYYPAG
jgi:DegV family protein with EDD domain